MELLEAAHRAAVSHLGRRSNSPVLETEEGVSDLDTSAVAASVEVFDVKPRSAINAILAYSADQSGLKKLPQDMRRELDGESATLPHVGVPVPEVVACDSFENYPPIDLMAAVCAVKPKDSVARDEHANVGQSYLDSPLADGHISRNSGDDDSDELREIVARYNRLHTKDTAVQYSDHGGVGHSPTLSTVSDISQHRIGSQFATPAKQLEERAPSDSRPGSTVGAIDNADKVVAILREVLPHDVARSPTPAEMVQRTRVAIKLASSFSPGGTTLIHRHPYYLTPPAVTTQTGKKIELRTPEQSRNFKSNKVLFQPQATSSARKVAFSASRSSSLTHSGSVHALERSSTPKNPPFGSATPRFLQKKQDETVGIKQEKKGGIPHFERRADGKVIVPKPVTDLATARTDRSMSVSARRSKSVESSRSRDDTVRHPVIPMLNLANVRPALTTVPMKQEKDIVKQSRASQLRRHLIEEERLAAEAAARKTARKLSLGSNGAR